MANPYRVKATRKFSEPYHIRIPPEADKTARQIAANADLDILVVLRMAIKAGLPRVESQLAGDGK